MNDQTDSQLLRAYAEHRAEPAFAELVRRHVDFVYSAALRMVCDPHLAQDVTQSAFVALAKNAAQLTDRPVLSGWLHRTAQNIAAQTVRTDVRRRVREQEAAAMNELLAAEPDLVWEHIAPQLDAALGELKEADRDALLLRYFEHKSASEMATTLGVSDQAAQKRVNRAVERLREFFAKRGLTVGASGLVVAISANSVQAAPVGLAVTISTAAALVGTAITKAATATGIKTIAMTALQKNLVTAALAIVAAVGIYEARQAARLRDLVRTLQQQHVLVAGQVQQLQAEHDDAASKLASLRNENERLNLNTPELLRLRGLVGLLRNQLALVTNVPQPAATQSLPQPSHPAWRLREPRRFEEFQNVGNETPEAAAETVLWAAFNKSTNLLDMVHMPADALVKAEEQGMLDILPRALGALILGGASAVKGESGQVWLDGGQETTFTRTDTTSTNTYVGVLDFRLSGQGKGDLGDPATESHTDMLFAKVDGIWKLVMPGLSPQILKK